MYHFSITIHLHLVSFNHNILSKKLVGEMLIERNVEFELMGLGPPGRMCSPVAG